MLCPCGLPALARGWCSSHYARWRRTGNANTTSPIGYRSVAERFASYVDSSGGPGACWPWTGARNGFGYGRFSVDRRTIGAHRYALLGLAPSQYAVLHTCDNPPCCNPKHLRLGTLADNNAERSSKGRSATWRQWAHAKLTPARVTEIRARYASGTETQQHIANDMGISQALVSQVVRGRTKIA